VQGAICFLRQDASGNTINELQYYDGSNWITFIPNQTGKSGYFLKSDGIITTWENIPDTFTAGFLLMGGG
jgi:hypothetical protein